MQQIVVPAFSGGDRGLRPETELPCVGAGESSTRLEAEPLESALDELEWKRWLTAEPRGYSFVARLVKAIIFVELLTPGQRRRIEEAAET